jgi:hypothetical protein
MTVEVTIHNRDAHEILGIVAQLRADGCQQGQDFDFAFHRRHWDPMTGDIEGSTKFIFYTEKYASMFALKYGS